MINDDWSLDGLIQQWGLERINRAIRPLFLGVDEENQLELPTGAGSDCRTKRQLELSVFIVSASVNDPELWNSATVTQQNAMLMACCEFYLDMDSLASDLSDIIEPPGDEGAELSDE